MEIKQVLDDAHKAAIKECHEKGHDWTPWEAVKFVNGEERQCKRCRRNTGIIGGNPPSHCYAIGSTWKSVDVAASYIESLG